MGNLKNILNQMRIAYTIAALAACSDAITLGDSGSTGSTVPIIFNNNSHIAEEIDQSLEPWDGTGSAPTFWFSDHGDKKNYLDAVRACEQKGMTLASIRNHEEWKWMKDYDNRTCWMIGRRQDDLGHWHN